MLHVVGVGMEVRPTGALAGREGPVWSLSLGCLQGGLGGNGSRRLHSGYRPWGSFDIE